MNVDNIIKVAKDEDEKIFVKKMIDIFERVSEKGYTRLTAFLDPGQMYLLEYIAASYKDIEINKFGGLENSERVRTAVTLKNFVSSEIDFEIEILSIKSNKFSGEMTHRDVLGTILGRGVEREKVGDILVTEDNDAYVFVTKGISQYLLENTNKVGRDHIEIERINEINVEKLRIKKDLKENTIISSSLRIDNIISSAFGISRSNASEIVDNGSVKINFRLETSKHKEVKDGDILSVKGFGRCKILKIKGETKKGRRVIDIES